MSASAEERALNERIDRLLLHSRGGGGEGGGGGGPEDVDDDAPCWRRCWNITCCVLARRRLRRAGELCVALGTQPLDDIASYYGEAIAFYFAWMQFYTAALCVPAAGGLILFGYQCVYGLDNALNPFYALFLSLWTTLFTEFWRRRNYALAHRWGVLNYEEEEVMRPEFEGEWIVDPHVPTRRVKTYSWLRRVPKYLSSVPVLCLCTVCVLALMLLVFTARDSALAGFDAPAPGSNGTASARGAIKPHPESIAWWFVLLGAPLVFSWVVVAMDAGYRALAMWFNVWENHRTETIFRAHLIAKNVPFRFFWCFASLCALRRARACRSACRPSHTHARAAGITTASHPAAR